MRKFISKAWNIFEIAFLASWATIAVHMGKVLSAQANANPPDVAAILFTVKQAAAVLFYGGLAAIVVKAVDSPLQNDLDEWAGLLVHRKVPTSPPTPIDPPPQNGVDSNPPAVQPPKI
jgi:hypothetical protein